jgi:DNA-3-methyladenine glycosylase
MSRILPLPRKFYEQSTLDVAKHLLGKYLLRETANGLLETQIVDVEAYVGPQDKACHASKGRTKRTEVMFGPAGYTYVYMIYGMYHCLNLVTEVEGYPAAILIRGLAIAPQANEGQVCTHIDGPGRVCRFLELDRTHNALDATIGRVIWVEDRGATVPPKHIEALPRIGVDYAGEWAQKPWRFRLPVPSSQRKRKTLPR